MTVLATVHGAGEAAEKVGVILAALLVAAAVLGRDRLRPLQRAVAAVAVLVLTPVLLVADIWGTSQLRHLRGHPAEAAGAILLGLAVLAALVVLFRRRPAAMPVLAVAAVPFRLPISTGGSTANLLIPLYLVIAAGVLAEALPGRADGGVEPRAGRLEWLLMGSVVLYAVQCAYSADFSRGLENEVFFYLPFALLFVLLRRVRWTPRLLLACLGAIVALAVLFSGIGFGEYAGKHLLLNPKVVQANQYDNYFRVNSLFFDPNIYGRFLALVMIAIAALITVERRDRVVVAAGVVALWLMGGLITSFSQSSIAALLLGLAIVAAVRIDLYRTLATALALVALAAAFVLAAPRSLHVGGFTSSKSANNATSGRYDLIRNGIDLFADRPLQGFGPGSFPQEYIAHAAADSERATSASHTIPITVAAEQGIPGLAVYLALLVACFGRLFSRLGGSIPRLVVAACFSALVLHTMAYADFLEDPLTWTLLGVGTALAASRAPRPVPRAATEVPAATAPTAA